MHFPQTDDKSILVSHVPVSCQLEQYYLESIGENCKNTWYSEWCFIVDLSLLLTYVAVIFKPLPFPRRKTNRIYAFVWNMNESVIIKHLWICKKGYQCYSPVEIDQQFCFFVCVFSLILSELYRVFDILLILRLLIYKHLSLNASLVTSTQTVLTTFKITTVLKQKKYLMSSPGPSPSLSPCPNSCPVE